LAGGLREVGMVVRCGVELGHNVATGAHGGLTKWHTTGQERDDIGVSRVTSCAKLGIESGSAAEELRSG
jgi:hypothetical protein